MYFAQIFKGTTAQHVGTAFGIKTTVNKYMNFKTHYLKKKKQSDRNDINF